MPNTIRPKHFLKAAIVATLLFIGFTGALEYYWRSKGYELSYNDDKAFWASERRKIYEPANRATIFIGSSRIKWDIDIETWEKLTGEKAVQLAIVGSSPRKVLLDLADDEKFAGKLIMDVMEPLVFGLDTTRSEKFVREALDYYQNETPAQRASAALGHALESQFVFLEESKFGLNQKFVEISQANNRKGVVPQRIPFRKEYIKTTARRQNKFTPIFLNNPELIKVHVKNWVANMNANRSRMRIPKDKSLDSLILVYKTAFDKIRARGGTVILIRPPSNGPHLESENKLFPRAMYWEQLLKQSNTPGIYYGDYPATAGMVCTEASHLNPDDAIAYTTSLVKTLQSEYGWKFNIKPKS